ncbi:hypothetical protein H8L32_11150 [Undibacterium sp. CY18W]|uniref:Uncharacterized protein n=1 Tax=Undibacterium hunanense TaxID=2762292 RepID=A0ABR6ZQ86_9BURK|nr:hypothetical protein [Undibacterium hunanense]MBC3918034.1 hypothetical protein [Undibacterium hunanense]
MHTPRNPCYTSNIGPSFSISCTAQTASPQRNCKDQKQQQSQKQLQRQKQQQPQKPRLINGIHYNLSFGCIDVAVAVVFDSVFDFNPLGTM